MSRKKAVEICGNLTKTESIEMVVMWFFHMIGTPYLFLKMDNGLKMNKNTQ